MKCFIVGRYENSMNQYFPNCRHITLQHHAWVRKTLKIQDKLMDCNGTWDEKVTDIVLGSIFQVSLRHALICL